MTVDDYRPAEYWARRLADVGGLRSTGHVSYAETYNRWLYRRKSIVLRRALRGARLERVADLGSGSGWVIEQLERRGAREIRGVDISAGAVAALRRRFPRHEFHHVALGERAVPIEHGWATCVTFLDVTYHIVDDTLWADAVRDATRLLEPGGRLVVIDAFGPTETRPAPHVRFRSMGSWADTATAAGLELAAVRPCYRWLSRPPGASVLRRLPQSARGAIELVLDGVAPEPAHMRAAVFRRR